MPLKVTYRENNSKFKTESYICADPNKQWTKLRCKEHKMWFYLQFTKDILKYMF